MSKPILCLDFDGVLHAYTSRWQGATTIPDGPVRGAMSFLRAAVEDFDVCISSSRSGELGGIEAMQHALAEWLAEEYSEDVGMIVLDRIRFPGMKPAAFLIIDDRALTFTGVFPDPSDLLGFKTWQQKEH